MARNLLLTTLTATCLLACSDDKDVTTGLSGAITTVTTATTSDNTTFGASTGQSTTDDSGSGSASESSGDATTDATTTTTTDATTTTTTGLDTTGSTGSDTTGTTGPVDPLQECLSMVELGDECGECSCMNCLEQLQVCQADEGCMEIWMCAQDYGCSGLDCFQPCGDVFNMYGGPFGLSGMKVQALGNCVGTQCPGLCST